MITGFEITLPKKPEVADEFAAIALKKIAEAIDREVFEDVKFHIVSPDGKVPGLTDQPSLSIINGGKRKKHEQR